MNLNNKIYQDEDAARSHLEAVRWPSGCVCPLCGGIDKIRPVRMLSKPSRKNPEPNEQKGWYHCGDCRRKFTVRTGTVYERSHVPLHKWVLATQLLCSSKKGMSAHQLHRMIGVTYKTAWFMFHRIRESMLAVNPSPLGGLDKLVQADETYIGKKAVKSTKTTSGRPFTKTGGGGVHKNAVVSLVSEGKARTFHVDRADMKTIREILVRNVDPKTTLHTDESRLYTKVGKEYADHQTVNHSKGEFARNGVTTNNVENYFSIFKRGMRGVYQHCSERHLQRYLTEFDFRYNSRDINDFERAEMAVRGAEGKRLTYRRVSKQRTI